MRAATSRVCPFGIVEEKAFLKALENTQSWERQGKVLRFYSASGFPVLEMREKY